MTNKADLLLVLHFHQPVGNFDYIIKRVCDRCYKPFLNMISRYPKIKWNLHFSGSLLEWLESNAPDIIASIRKMVKNGQAELMAGAMYEPILSIIPERDRMGQIESMRRYISSLFHTDAKGAWIPERTWEPHLVSSMAKAGIEYVTLDDTHLLYAGLKKEETYGYFVSEDNGSMVRVFPSDKKLRYNIPFSEPEETFDYMKKVAKQVSNPLFTYADDVEKFGEWPNTFRLVYEQKWLERFLNGLTENNGWLTTLKLSDCLNNIMPSGAVYIPTASYEEMLKWALPVQAEVSLQKIEDELEREGRRDEYLPFIRGGFFRNFFAKYHEANQMHKRMLYVSKMLGRSHGSAGRGLKEAYKELYKGQCNCAYWHGLFGGLYLYHLRKATYEHILRAEKIYSDSVTAGKRPRCEITDFDADGYDEAIMQNRDIWLCVKPSSGGTIVELDVKKSSLNLLNVLTRYRELYHENMSETLEAEKGKELRLRRPSKSGRDIGRIPYDGYRRAMFVDHFFGEEVTLRDFEEADYDEKGDFVDSKYDFKVAKGGDLLTMKRDGRAYGQKVKLSKEIVLKGAKLEVTYNIKNAGKSKRRFRFATEIPFIMPDADSWQYNYFLDNEGYNIDTRGETDDIRGMRIADAKSELAISLDSSKACSLWRFPITTFSRSEKGFEENYQGSVIVPNWRFTLKDGENFRVTLSFAVGMPPISRDKAQWKEEASIQL